MFKSPSPSRAPLVRHSLYKLNIIGDKQHPCLTPLPICTLLVSPRSSRTLTFCSMYNLLINLLSHQTMPVLFRVCINLVQFTRLNAFCQSMKKTHIRRCMISHKVQTDPVSWPSSQNICCDPEVSCSNLDKEAVFLTDSSHDFTQSHNLWQNTHDFSHQHLF
jgi:hypothetical protein